MSKSGVIIQAWDDPIVRTRLEQLAANRQTTVSALVREAVLNFLAENGYSA